MSAAGEPTSSRSDDSEECPISPGMMLTSSGESDDVAYPTLGLPRARPENSVVGLGAGDDNWTRSGSGRDLSSDELLHLAMAMAEVEAEAQPEVAGDDAATGAPMLPNHALSPKPWATGVAGKPRGPQWLDSLGATAPPAPITDMQAVEDDLAWRLQSTLAAQAGIDGGLAHLDNGCERPDPDPDGTRSRPVATDSITSPAQRVVRSGRTTGNYNCMLIGNSAVEAISPDDDEHCWSWSVFVRPSWGPTGLSQTIKSVEFDLTDAGQGCSVSDRFRHREEEPFEVTGRSLSKRDVFQVGVTISYHSGYHSEHTHELSLNAAETIAHVPFPLHAAHVNVAQQPAAGGSGADDIQEQSEESELPEFIVQLEHAEVEFYRQLLRKGRRKLEYSKLMIMGPGRVGKTSMLRQLTGQHFDSDEASTRGVDACSVDVRTWRPSDRGDTTGEGALQAGSTETGGLSVYRDALADELAEREVEIRSASAAAANDDVVVDETAEGSAASSEFQDIGITMFAWSSETSSKSNLPGNHRTAEQLHEMNADSLSQSAALVPGTRPSQVQDKVDLSQQERATAAINIQSAWRGLLGRRLANGMRKEFTDPGFREAIADRIRRRLDRQTLSRKHEVPESEDGKVGHRLMTVLDFAGQRMYYVMHHVLMSDRLAVYIVCMSLASDPDALTDGDEGSCSTSVAMTVLENLHFWLNSIAAQAPKAPIIVVGTHADVVDETKRKAVVTRVEASFVDRAFERQLVGGGIHCISCVTGHGIDELRRIVEDTAVQLPEYGRPIPLGWLRFCEQMQSLVEKGTLRLRLAELRSCATACSISMTDKDDQVSELGLCLRFFTDVGLLMHYDHPNTRDLVVLKPQWLLDSMSKLCDGQELLRKSKLLRSVSQDVAPEWRMLLQHGRLDAAKLTRHVWVDADPADCAGILALMQRFGLCALLPHHEETENSVYVVPSLLPEWSRAVGTQLSGEHERSKVAGLWTDENSVVATVRSIHQDGYWEDQPPSFMPEAVFFSLQMSLLGTLGAASDVRACRHLYRDRALLFGHEDYYVHRVACEQLLRIVVRVDSGDEPARVARRVMSCLEGEPGVASSRGIAARFGLKFQLAVDCRHCGAVVAVVQDHCGEVYKCSQCRSNQVATVDIWCNADGELRDKPARPTTDDSVAELGPTLREAMGRDPIFTPQDSELEQEEQVRLRTHLSHSSSAATEDDITARELHSMLIPWSDLQHEGKGNAPLVLGKGGFGVVMKMKFLGSTEVAVKALTSTDEVALGSTAATEFLRELKFLKGLHHPNVIQLLGVTQGSFFHAKAGGKSSVGGQEWMLVTEFMRHGSLYDLLHSKKSQLRWRTRISVMTQVAQAMVYLHADLPSKPPIVHLDLKPGNILLSGDRAKVADFGLSIAGRRSTGGQLGNDNGAQPHVGTYEYTAPEMFLGTGVGTAADVYAFAMIMWEVEARTPVWSGMALAMGRPEELPQIARKLTPLWVALQNKRPRLPAALESERDRKCPPGWVALMEQCWKAKPQERPRFPAVVATLQRMQVAESKPTSMPAPVPAPEPEMEQRKLPAPQSLQQAPTNRSGIWNRLWPQLIWAIFAKLRSAFFWLWPRANTVSLERSASRALDPGTGASGNETGELMPGAKKTVATD